jgi:two-component system chemotaxis response regulator CheY
MNDNKYAADQITVLIIDDHDPIRKAMKAVVAAMGVVNVLECNDGADAIALLEKRPVDLILCDLYMRKASGFEVLQHVRNRTIGSDIPVIVVTGEASKEDIVKASDLGANEYILKPFQADALEAKISKVLNEFFSPSTLLQLLRTGDKHIIRKDYEGAIETFRAALNIDGDSQRAKHSIAVATLLMGHEKEAQKMLEANIKEASSYYRNYVTLANLHLKRKNVPEAIRAISMELELHPKQTARQSLLAKLMLKLGDLDGAINHFREALKEDAKHEGSLMGMGQAFAKKGDLEKALYYFKRLRRHRPDSTKALLLGVQCCIEANDPRKAEMFLRDEKQRNPTRLDIFGILAKFYISQSRIDEAVVVLNDLFEKAPDDVEGLKIKGALEMKLKKFGEAAATFKRLTKLSPSLEIYMGFAECSEKIGQHKDTIAALTRCLILDNKNAQAFYRLGIALYNTRQYSKAHSIFMRAQVLGWDRTQVSKYLSLSLQAVTARRAAAHPIAS